MNLFYIAFGGALGALARYGMAQWVATWWGGDFPLGTWITNLLGCFLMGLVFPEFAEIEIPLQWRLFFMTGFLGAYTTFSTFSLETWQLANRGDVFTALLNIGASVVFGLAMTAFGIWLRMR
jgi:CrcB protein